MKFDLGDMVDLDGLVYEELHGTLSGIMQDFEEFVNLDFDRYFYDALNPW